MRRPFLPAIGALVGAYWLLTIIVIGLDPLALYPWGIHATVRTDGNYSMESTPFLIDAVAKDPAIDTLFLGGSTGHFYTPQMMEQLLPGTHRAFTLAYARPSSVDRAVINQQILRHSHARHFIVEADWTYIVPMRDQRAAPSFPLYLYDDTWWNDVRQINTQTIKLSFAALSSNSLWIPSWGKSVERLANERQYTAIQSPAFGEKYTAMVARRQDTVDTPSTLNCEAMDAVGAILVPFVRALSQRGAQIDLLFPPYSFLIYYRAGEPNDPFNRTSLLNDVLLLRSCIVHAVDGMAGVRVFAFDDQAWIGGDFHKYMDAGHLYDAEVNRFILESIANGQHQLSPANIEARNAEMRSNVIHFQFAPLKPGN